MELTMNLKSCLDAIDQLHSQDPSQIEGKAGELIYAQRMTEWLNKLNANPSQELQIAVRSQHLCRWEITRKDYPMDKQGYFKWRTDLAKLHAEKAGECMLANGFSDDAVEKTKTIIRKKNLKKDSDVQTMEDCACLVFIENDFLPFAAKFDEEKVIDIVQKTWKKMSEQGHQAALALDLPEEALAVITKALS
jgi:hypothetical protein